jgi:nickel/cobalt exporter
MNSAIMPLISIAALTGIVHTLIGPDHYLPFIALAKARSWSRKTTLWITSLCGLGHILSSIMIAYFALGLRASLNSLHIIDSYRSDFAAWALIAFGCVYFIWGLKKLYKEKTQAQSIAVNGKSNLILWSLFVIFVVGPCEPLFFLMTYPSLASNPSAIMLLVGVFGAATMVTMVTVVLSASFGLSFLRNKEIVRFAPVATGAVIMFCGVGIKFLGL